MDNLLKPNSLYENQTNTYYITRLIKKNSLSTDDLWVQIKANIASYIINKYKCKKVNIITSNNNTNIIAIKSNYLNLNVKFYTVSISEDSRDENIVFIANKNEPDVSMHTSIYDINQDFYNFIKINDSILDLSVAA